MRIRRSQGTLDLVPESTSETSGLLDVVAGMVRLQICIPLATQDSVSPASPGKDSVMRPRMTDVSEQDIVAFILGQEHLRHSPRDVIAHVAPDGIPIRVDGKQNPQYTRVLTRIKKIRKQIERQRKAAFVPVPGGRTGEVMLQA